MTKSWPIQEGLSRAMPTGRETNMDTLTLPMSLASPSSLPPTPWIHSLSPFCCDFAVSYKSAYIPGCGGAARGVPV